ncbi:hypothetical protein KXW62_008429 [Aspergillus fumigatus]|nr:hypothetical protein KXW62_008429 [Aspergillus fumigatus]
MKLYLIRHAECGHNVGQAAGDESKQMNDMNMSPNEMMFNVDTTITACATCVNDLNLKSMCAEELMKMEMDMYKSPNKTMSLRICVDENNTTVVTPSVIEYRNRIMNKLALMSPPSTPVRR